MQAMLQLMQAVQPLVTAVNQHSVFTHINSIPRLRRFAEIHVYAVWDFMALLKALQRHLTSTAILWTPPQNHLGCHLVNSLLAEEESDTVFDGRYQSHFELYLQAMHECGANTDPINAFIQHIRHQSMAIALKIGSF